MAHLNLCCIMGNLTKDPELRHTKDGTPVSELTVAMNRKYRDKQGGDREEVTFVDVSVWSKQATSCCEHLQKGSLVHVVGSLKLDTWTDKNGQKTSKLKVEADSVQFLGRLKERSS